MKTNTCTDCGTPISQYYYTRCKQCASKTKRGKNSPHWKGGFPKCVDCGAQLSTYKKDKCKSCAAKSRKIYYGQENGNWMGGKPKCEVCGKQLNHYYARKCSGCYVDTLKGNTHPSWRGGKSFEPYPIGWTKTFKEQIRYRDGYKCQLCGMPEVENGRKLDVHHIDYDKKNLDQYNLISLCRKCHSRTNTNREYWNAHFKNMMEEI